MPLKMTLEPQEWVMLGGTRVVNIWDETAKFDIGGAGPVLRQEHTLSESDADDTAKRVYLSVQMAYLGLTSSLDRYSSLVQDLLVQRPETSDVVQKANAQISNGSFYGALREYRKLIKLSNGVPAL
jgi:flagellar biosynthesis regulator FlbT